MHNGQCTGPSYLSTTDKGLAGVPRSRIRDQLLEVGFDDDRQSETVGGLSGGWKMKLELARAMLYNADLLLLDEVSSSRSLFRASLIDLRSSLPTTYVLRFSWHGVADC